MVWSAFALGGHTLTVSATVVPRPPSKSSSSERSQVLLQALIFRLQSTDVSGACALSRGRCQEPLAGWWGAYNYLHAGSTRLPTHRQPSRPSTRSSKGGRDFEEVRVTGRNGSESPPERAVPVVQRQFGLVACQCLDRSRASSGIRCMPRVQDILRGRDIGSSCAARSSQASSDSRDRWA